MSADLLRPTARAWQRMLSGRRLDLLDPSPLDVELTDIAHGLARVARWNGQTIGDHAFSVAQHCVAVEQIAHLLKPTLEAHWRLTILLHDAPEYVIGDMISPFKNVMGGQYRHVEERLHHAIQRAFHLPPEVPGLITKLAKKADLISAYLEAIHLAGFNKEEATKIFGKPAQLTQIQLDDLAQHIEPLPTKEAQEAFLSRFHELDTLRKK